jgi:uncharacterized protein YndB with AHSA1/START domain
MPSFELERTIRASIDTVWDVLTDHRAYVKWAGIDESKLDREGTPDPNGKGAVRFIRKGPISIREEIVASEKPRTFSYTIVSGPPVRDYLAVVTLTEAGKDTRVRWTVRFDPKIPFTGFALKPVVKKVVSDLLVGAAREAERRG